LLTGAMRPQASGLSRADAGAIAAFVTAGAVASAPRLHPNPCREPLAPLEMNGTGWNGWSADLANTRFQPHPGLAAQNVSRLKLKWAFTFPGAMTWGQPTVVGGRVFVASTTGEVYALDAESGCTVWSLHVGTPVRTAISIGPAARAPGAAAASGARAGAAGRREVAYFGDLAGVVHAVDADTGVELWRVRVEKHPNARITGAPVLFGSRLLVPVSSFEEGPAADPAYACCTFRGSVAALDATTGRQIWKAYTISEAPHPTSKNAAGVQLHGPSGASVWSSPTIDVQRGALYVATGNSYSNPAADTSDAIVAFDLKTGQMLWHQQATPKDSFVVACFGATQTNCPEDHGPDHDFGQSPILVSLRDGRRVLVVGQKSGVVHAFDPDAQGKLLWQTRVGKGGPLGGMEWGSAADQDRIYIANSDVRFLRDGTRRLDPTQGGGLFALDLSDGKVTMQVSPVSCEDRDRCSPALSAAVTVIPGVVFAGGVSGYLRAYATDDARLLWEFDTARDYVTVNGVSGHGGAIDGAGPVVVDGMLYVNSGYAQWSGVPGNVLLAFGTADR